MVWNINFMTFHILGMSSSQLLLTPSFFRGVAQPPTSIVMPVNVRISATIGDLHKYSGMRIHHPVSTETHLAKTQKSVRWRKPNCVIHFLLFYYFGHTDSKFECK